MYKVYVFTRAFNEEKRVRRCVDSVLSQTYTDFEYLLLDNGSKDATGQIISEYAERDQRIRPFYYAENKPGVLDFFLDLIFTESSENTFFCTLDADDEYTPDFLKKMLGFITENNLDAAACGNNFINVPTGKTVGVRSLQRNVILDDGAFGDYFPAYHQFMRTVWGKIFSTSLLRKCNFETQRKFTYGADTLFTMEAFRNASRVGILAESLHKYYVSPKSISHQFDKKRISSDQVLFDAARDFLISKCGTVSNENLRFLFLVYINAIHDTLNVLFKAQISLSDKVRNLLDICQSEHTQELIKWPDVVSEKNKLFSQIALWVLSQAEVQNGDYLDAAADILSALSVYPSQVTGWSEGLVFMLLSKMKDKQIQKGLPCGSESNIIAITSNLPILAGFDTGFLTYFRNIVCSILDKEEKKALDQIKEVIAQETDIPDEYIDDFLTLGLNLSAKQERTDDFIYFKKLQISFFIDLSRIEDALKEMADWDTVLPDDIDFKALRARLNQ